MTSKRTVAVLLKEVYSAHVLTVESLTNHIEVLVRKCDRLTKFKDDILTRGKELQRRYDKLCVEHRLTQLTLVEARTSDTDGTQVSSFLKLDDDIGSRFSGFESVGSNTEPQQDYAGMDSCDGDVSTGRRVGEGEMVGDTSGGGRLKLGNGRKRARYSEEEKQIKKQKVKHSCSDRNPVIHGDCHRMQKCKTENLANNAIAINADHAVTANNYADCDITTTASENNHRKCDKQTRGIAQSNKCQTDSTKQTDDLNKPSEYKIDSDRPVKWDRSRKTDFKNTPTQKEQRNKYVDVSNHSCGKQKDERQSGRNDVLRFSEMEFVHEKDDSLQVLCVPETCYPDSCDPHCSPVSKDTVDPGHTEVTGDSPSTTPIKLPKMKIGNYKTQSNDTATVPNNSSQVTKQNIKICGNDTAITPIKLSRLEKQNFYSRESRGRSNEATGDKCHSLVDNDTNQDNLCSVDGDESGNVSEVFLLPEARFPGTFISPRCNSTHVESTNHVTGITGTLHNGYDNPSCDTPGHGIPKCPSLQDSPVFCSPKHKGRKILRQKSAGSPLLFDDDDNVTSNIRKSRRKAHARQMSEDTDLTGRTRCREQLGGRRDAGQAEGTITQGQLLSSIDASKATDSIFFKDSEPRMSSLSTARKIQRKKGESKLTKTSTSDGSSRRLVQMTLSQHLQPNNDRAATVSTLSRVEEEGQLLIERAKKASLQDPRAAVLHRESSVSPQAPDISESEFKELLTPDKAGKGKDVAVSPQCSNRRDRANTSKVVPETVLDDWYEREEEVDRQLNGSVDLDIHLSAYILTQEGAGRSTCCRSEAGRKSREEWDKGEREADSCATSVVFAPLRHPQVAPPETLEEDLQDEDDDTERPVDMEQNIDVNNVMQQEKKVLEDSFDRVPKAPRPNYAYREVVRKQAERRQLHATVCPQCEQYFNTLELSDEEKRERMKSCRHRDRFAPPQTPEHFWSVGFPDTQECENRGYIHVTQARPSRFRRKRGLKKLFNDNTEEDHLTLL